MLVGCLKKSGTFQRVHWTHCTGACCQLSTGPHVHAGVSGADNDAHTQLAATTRCHRMSLPAASLRPRNRAEGSQETYSESELSARVEWHVSTCGGGRSWPAATSRRHGAWSAWHAWRAQAAASMGSRIPLGTTTQLRRKWNSDRGRLELERPPRTQARAKRSLSLQLRLHLRRT